MSFLWTVASLVLAIVVVRISHWLYRWSNPNPNCMGKLPRGSMGFPIIGETVDFFEPYGFYEIPPFLEKRLLRYGPLFRTNIFGSKTVFVTDPDVIFEIFRQENKAFTFSYPGMFENLTGKKDNLFFKVGNIHKHIKHFTLHFLGAESLKTKMIGKMDQNIHNHLRLKASEGSFDVSEEVSNMVVASMTSMVVGNLEPETQAKLVDNFKSFCLHEWFRSPLALSTWKAINRARKAYRETTQMIKDIIKRRKESKEKHADFIDTVLEELEKENSLMDEGAAICLIYGILVVPKESVNSATSVAVKFLSENPKALAELKKEHEVLHKRGDKEAGVSWEEYRHNMSFTNMVISESLRLANMGPVLFRKALMDVEIKGYIIPAGWVVAVAPALVHFDKAIYENPLEFNPWRWEGKDTVRGSKTFMVFGGGVRSCVGAEFARLHMALFLHHLVTTYDFSLVQDCEIIRTPFLHLTKGLSINIFKSSK